MSRTEDERPHAALEDAARGTSFAALLTESKAVVEIELARIWETRTHFRPVAPMTEVARDLTLRGGKRLRAALAILAYSACRRGAPLGPAIAAATSLELLQTYLLIQDDWMDGDRLRRGGPSVHAALATRFDSEHLGAATAILASDQVWSMAAETLRAASAEPAHVLEALRWFFDTHELVVGGQMLDVIRADYPAKSIYFRKTAGYTTIGPLLIGAALAGASKAIESELYSFAFQLGVAFQMRDDLLGLFGVEEETGKPVGRDLTNGKRTVLIEEARQRMNESQRTVLEAALDKPDASDEAVRAATRAIEECGARAAVEAQLRDLLSDATARAKKLPFDDQARALFVGAAEALGR